ncbi:hypothetical protein ACQKQA_12040 [Pseudomonas sp. NPDC089530]|uniref:hypothetical protein n=1 Tax=Pseudomonas sp. NPDC089530 TaxID=3390651 RepID=UPI003D08C1C1
MNQKKLMAARQLAGVLMLLSGGTHLSQLWVYGMALNVIGAASFGAIYVVVGWLLLRPGTLGLWLGAYLPTVGGICGAARFMLVHPNPFSLFHIGIDLIVVPICLYSLVLEYRRLKRLAEPQAF